MFIQTVGEALSILRMVEAQITAGEREAAAINLRAIVGFISEDTTRRTPAYNRLVFRVKSAKIALAA